MPKSRRPYPAAFRQQMMELFDWTMSWRNK